VLTAFAVIGVLANRMLERQFEKYVVDKLEQNAEEISLTLSERYLRWGESWDTDGVESIGMSALGDGLILRVEGPDGSVIWDAIEHNSGMCAALLQQMAENMESRYTGFQGGYAEKTYPVSAAGKTVGKAVVGYYGPYFYTENDLAFIGTLNTLLLAAAAAAGVTAVLLAAYMARRLSSPIGRVVDAAGQIAKGSYSGRVSEKSSTREIITLTGAINALAESLDKQERLRKRLTADVAHELRTPLANLQGQLEAMIDGIWQPDAKRLQSCHEETLRLARITGDLETLSRYESDGIALHRERFDVSELIAQVLDSFESTFIKKHITLAADNRPVILEADGDKLGQVLINLLSNALKFTPDGGEVAVTAEESDDRVKIIVKDTGIGIAAEDQPLIFERFYRADKSRSRSTGGSGIGLAIVRSIVEAHGGTVGVRSRPGRGSEFIVLLPKSNPERDRKGSRPAGLAE